MAYQMLKDEPLEVEVNHIEEEARMVLPGIQALFGFQLIAAFNQNFKNLLSQVDQNLHLAALVLVALSVLFAMAPAAYHRQAEPARVSKRFAQLATSWLTWAMVPLMFAISFDVYVIANLITASMVASVVLASGLFVSYLGLWFIYPRFQRTHS